MKKKTSILLKTLIGILFLQISFTGCYSVFSGGTGGIVVDSESSSNPKRGIANVDVYAYTNQKERDNDFKSWKSGTKFRPSGYYGHTTTASDGSFSISKLVWKESFPDFGKDADYTNVYMLFYHENYGLTKGQTLIVSDSFSNTIYQELKSVKKSTILNINLIDVTSGNNTNHSVLVKVSVPQSTDEVVAADKVYETIITGTGSIAVNYPRWLNEEDRLSEIENTPEVKISYAQSSDEITWKACFNGDNSEKNYAFWPEDKTEIIKTIKNPSYTINLYGKPTRHNIPVVNGQLKVKGDEGDDGIVVSMTAASTSEDLGQVTTYSQSLGTTGLEKHGVFSGLGSGRYWNDSDYTGKFATLNVKVSGGGKEKTVQLRSDVSSFTVQLQ